MVKSNIKIASNIYITPAEKVEQNKDFVQNISGYDALKKFKERYISGSFSNIRFTSVQKEEVSQHPTCSLAKNKEHTHGKIRENGRFRYVGRCEYRECSKYNICDSVLRIQRVEGQFVSTEDSNIEFQNFDIDYKINFEDVLEKVTKQENLVEIQEVIDDVADEIITPFVYQEKFKKTNAMDAIVHSDIDSKILVNAGPGTGKTYCAISRLIYILENKLVSPEKILMLCYSKSAVNVIRDRIKQAITNGDLSLSANDICVATFDSFAGGYVYHILEQAPKSYKETIALYNEKMDGEYLDRNNVEYLIIDELQDIVNERAKMVLNILKNIECGYLLLGDKCQAIYDFENGEDTSFCSEQFYNALETNLHSDTQYYELIGNKRQSENLASISDEIREVLLNVNENEQCSWIKDAICKESIDEINLKNLISNIKVKQESSDVSCANQESIAILCRTNGEVLMVGSELSKKGVAHTIRIGDKKNEKISRVIADILWDYTEAKISLSEFKERYFYRISNDEDAAVELYKSLFKITGTDEHEVLDLVSFKNELIQSKELPHEVSTKRHDLIISTIHKAKGQEFDRVYILENVNEQKNSTSMEARIQYVAVTRPKKHIEKINKNNRWYFGTDKKTNCYFQKAYKSSTYFYCSRIGVSKDEQIDALSFASAFEIEKNLDIQEYISESIHIWDPIIVQINSQKEYEIIHENKCIGKLSKQTFDEFRSVINQTGNRKSEPIRLEDLYVSDVYTVVSNKAVSKLSMQHSHSGFWLGVEITGMGTAKYPGYN